MSGDHFITPPPFGQVGEYASDLSVQLQTTLRIQWNASYANSSLWLIKDGDGLFCEELYLAKTWCHAIMPIILNSDHYDWSVNTYDIAYDSSNPAYFLELRSNPIMTVNSSSIGSHYFNILPAPGSSSSVSGSISSSVSSSISSIVANSISSAVSSSTATSHTTSSISASSSASSVTSKAISTSSSSATVAGGLTTSASSTAASPIATAASSSGLSGGTKAAIGVAVGIGVPLIAILLAILVVMTRRKKVRDRQAAPVPTSNIPPSYNDKKYTQTMITEPNQSTVYPRQEMEAHPYSPQSQQQPPSQRYELPTGQYR